MPLPARTRKDRPLRSHRLILEAPYCTDDTEPFESKHVLVRRLKQHAPEFYESMQNWRKLRYKDLVEVDGLDRPAAERRSWIEASLLNPPPGVLPNKPLAIVDLPQPIKRGNRNDLRTIEKRHRKHAAQLAAKIRAEDQSAVEAAAQAKAEARRAKAEAKEIQFLDEELFEDGWTTESPEEFIRDVMWTFNTLHRQAEPKDAPSPGAWSMLQFARENQDKFFGGLYPKTLEYSSKLAAARLAHERELKRMELEAELEEHRRNQMTAEEAKELAATLDLMAELGLSYPEASSGIELQKEPPPELAARMEP